MSIASHISMVVFAEETENERERERERERTRERQSSPRHVDAHHLDLLSKMEIDTAAAVLF